jgi:ABC-type bacteriocin/lantibiotic exporter with double-glycine peptidase domain
MHSTTSSPHHISDLFRIYWKQIGLTYLLYTLEEGLHLLYPFALGFSIDALLQGNARGILMIAGQHGGWLIVSTLRKVYDTRLFTKMYTDLVTQIIGQQQAQGVADSKVIARASLSHQLVDFFETDITSLLTSFYSIIGSLIILSVYSLPLVGYCLLLFVPLFLLNRWYQQRVTHLTRQENDQQEREVAEIRSAQPSRILAHYQQIRHWRVRLSDAEVLTYGTMEVFVLGLILASLLYYCQPKGRTVGDILAAFEYIMLFVSGLAQVPWLLQRVVAIRDVTGRLQVVPEESNA